MCSEIRCGHVLWAFVFRQTSGLPTFTDDIVDLEVLLCTPHTQEEWVDRLSKYDEHILTSGDWLSDKLVNAAQNLILQAIHTSVALKIQI